MPPHGLIGTFYGIAFTNPRLFYELSMIQTFGPWLADTGAVRRALETAGGVDPAAPHLDLYGGVGLFAAAIAEAGGAGTRK